MKKPSAYLWLRQARLSSYRARQRFLRKNKRWIPPDARYVIPGDVIKAPAEFNMIRGGGVQVVKFLRAIAQQVLVRGKPAKLDLRGTERFFVPGAILFFAELDRIIRLSPLPKPISIIDPRLRKPREVLKQIGFYELTQDSCDVVPSYDDVVFWQAAKGATQSGEQLQLLEPVANKANAGHKKQVELGGIWRGVSEAVANTVDHAYLKPRDDGFSEHPDTKWWMFTHVRDTMFTAAVCDLGCGYRSTINRYIPEIIVAKYGELFRGMNPDASAIQTAMEYGRSRTRQDNRGKGSRDALSILDGHGQGRLVILSNTAWVQYFFNNGKQTKVEIMELGIDIKGTIIWWNLPLE